MYQLTSKKSIGALTLAWVNGENETYQLGTARFSLTQFQDFYLLNFWVVSEYEVISLDGKVHLTTGPVLEILTKTSESPSSLTTLKVITPNRDKVWNDWDIIYRTGFYNQTHQDLNDSLLIISKAKNGLVNVEFSGIPGIDGNHYKVKGKCSIELSETLERYW